jgi:hypothetical protein
MKKSKSSISKARSYAEIGEFWDEHDLTNYWDKTRKVKFDVGSRTGSDVLSGLKRSFREDSVGSTQAGSFV